MTATTEQDKTIAVALTNALFTWRAFKAGHDLASVKMNCCEVSKQFFEAMDHLELELRTQAEMFLLEEEKNDGKIH